MLAKGEEEDWAEAAHDDLLDHLKKVCFSHKFSDMKVRLSNGEVIDCHRVIVCGQCKFFENALEQSCFEEGYAGIVNMPNDHPHAIKTLVEFLYTGNYSVDKDLDLSDQLLFHMDILDVATIYCVDLLSEIAAQWVNISIRDHLEAVIHVLPDLSRFLFKWTNSPVETRCPIMLEDLEETFRYQPELLLETETWDGLWEHAQEFMEHMTELFEEDWSDQCHDTCDHSAKKWLTKYVGKGSLLRVMRCPNQACGWLEGVILSKKKSSTWECMGCNGKVLLDGRLPVE